jgi:hypothetical protein
MQQIIYASTALTGLGLCDVQEILTTAHNKNKEFDLSGMLLYNRNYFLQLIEGNVNQLSNLMHNIKNDTRHHDIFIIGTKEIENRDFEEWSMGFVNDSRYLKEVMQKELDISSFNPYEFEYEQAKSLLRGLSYYV